MYFNFLPEVQYDLKPIKYPFSDSDFVVAKNFFKRYKISDTAFQSSVYYNKVSLKDGQRLDQIAETIYDNAEYDWVIALTNNMLNPLYDLPMSQSELQKHVESSYDNPYYDIHHYETLSEDKQIELLGQAVVKGEQVVDEYFYNRKEIYTASPLPPIAPDVTVSRNKEVYIPLDRTKGYDELFVNSGYSETGATYIDNEDPLLGVVQSIPSTETLGVINHRGLYDVDRYIYDNPGAEVDIRYINTTGINQLDYSVGFIDTKLFDLSQSDKFNLYLDYAGSPDPGDIIAVRLYSQQSGFTLSTILYLDNGANSISGDDFPYEFIDTGEFGFVGDNWEAKEFTFDIPENWRVENGFFRIIYIKDSTPVRDNFAIGGFSIESFYDFNRALGYDVTKIDDDNYVIDGVAWERIDGTWYKKTSNGIRYSDGGIIKEVDGNKISRPVTEFEYENRKNEEKREIYILKPELVETFVDEFRKASLYKKSSDYITNRLKKTGV